VTVSACGESSSLHTGRPWTAAHVRGHDFAAQSLMDATLPTRNAWLRLRIREQDREPGAILGARPRGQPRTTTDIHGDHVCGSEREGRLAGPVRTLGRGLRIRRLGVRIPPGAPTSLGETLLSDSVRCQESGEGDDRARDLYVARPTRRRARRPRPVHPELAMRFSTELRLLLGVCVAVRVVLVAVPEPALLCLRTNLPDRLVVQRGSAGSLDSREQP